MHFLKKVLTLLAMILIFNGCSSSKVTTKNISDDDFDWISNSDFVGPREVSYNASLDQYPDEVRALDSLGHESLARFPAFKLEQIEEVGGPISEIAKNCYQREYDKAFGLSDQLYHKYKNHPGYWNQIGTCYYLQGELKRALIFYNKSKALNETYTPAINNLGVIYLAEGQEQKSLQAFKKALASAPFSFTPQFNLSQIYLRYGLLDKSEASLEVLLNANKRDADVLSSLGTLNLLRGDVKKAILYFRNIDEKYLSKLEIAANYAVALKLNGDSGEALSVFSKINSEKMDGAKENYYYEVKNYLSR